MTVFVRFRLLVLRLLGASVLLFASTAQAAPDATGAPDRFVLDVANQMLDVLKADHARTMGKPDSPAEINRVVNAYVMPYVDFQKTTRLAAGHYWRQASDAQKIALADAFRGTLVRTYSGAMGKVNASTKISLLPFRGDPTAQDVVVRTVLDQNNQQPLEMDYRLERTPKGWSMYDLNVEGIWLIENYRNQFAQQINHDGIDGLIRALNQRNTQ